MAISRSFKDTMSAPPAGAKQAATIGDSPVNMKADTNIEPSTVEICCVLTGDWPAASQAHRERISDIGAHYVEQLYSMVSRYAPPNVRWQFCCFTDRKQIEGVPCKAIPSGLYGWFNKLYVFSPEAGYKPGTRVIYFDLDTCITGSWGPLAQVPIAKPVMLRDVWAANNPASGVMSWEVSASTMKIWSEFSARATLRPPYLHPRQSGATPSIRTDEEWLYHYLLPTNWTAWQDALPGAFLSYKYDLLRLNRRDGTRGQPISPEALKAAKVIYFHGNPRPHEVRAPWNPYWRGLLEPEQPIITASSLNERR